MSHQILGDDRRLIAFMDHYLHQLSLCVKLLSGRPGRHRSGDCRMRDIWHKRMRAIDLTHRSRSPCASCHGPLPMGSVAEVLSCDVHLTGIADRLRARIDRTPTDLADRRAGLLALTGHGREQVTDRRPFTADPATQTTKLSVELTVAVSVVRRATGCLDRSTALAVHGMSMWRTPRWLTASTTADCTAGSSRSCRSPMPLAPNG